MDLSTVVYVLGAVLYALWSRRSTASSDKSPVPPPVWTPPPPAPAAESPIVRQPLKSKPLKSKPPGQPFERPSSALRANKDLPSDSEFVEKNVEDLRPKDLQDWRKAVVWSSLVEPRFDQPYRGPSGTDV